MRPWFAVINSYFERFGLVPDRIERFFLTRPPHFGLVCFSALAIFSYGLVPNPKCIEPNCVNGVALFSFVSLPTFPSVRIRLALEEVANC